MSEPSKVKGALVGFGLIFVLLFSVFFVFIALGLIFWLGAWGFPALVVLWLLVSYIYEFHLPEAFRTSDTEVGGGDQ